MIETRAGAKPLYAALGIPDTATAEEIHDAFLAIARAHHPDVAGGAEASELFLAAKRAHDLLMDPTKRAAYDATGIDPEEHTRAVRSAAIHLITSTAFGLLADGATGNLLHSIRNSIDGTLFSIRSELRRVDRIIEKTESSAKEIGERWKGAEMIREAVVSMIRDQIGKDQASRRQHVQAVEVAEAAIALLANAEYEMPVPEPMPAYLRMATR